MADMKTTSKRFLGATASRRDRPRPAPKPTNSGGMWQPARPLSQIVHAALFTLLAAPASAAQWEFIPSLTAVETYTDNVHLSPRGTEQSDWVTILSPRLYLRGTGD